jgi:hypothetical protein
MYKVYMEIIYSKQLIESYRMCAVLFDWGLVVFPFLFCNFPSKSVSLMLAYFISSKWHAVLLQFHIYRQLANIKLHIQFFTTVTLVQFCGSKYHPLSFISLIAVQLACNHTEVVNHLHALRRLSINRILFITHFEYHAKYIHWLFNNSIHIALFNSNNPIS